LSKFNVDILSFYALRIVFNRYLFVSSVLSFIIHSYYSFKLI